MDLEAPVDAWYVWVGVAMVSVVAASVAIELPSTPPPDAAAAANTVDRVSGQEYGGSTTYEHSAQEFRVGPKRIWFRNGGGESTSSIAFGNMVLASYNDSMEEILYGASPREYYDDPADFRVASNQTQQVMLDDIETWRTADGTLRVRTVIWDDVRVTLVDF